MFSEFRVRYPQGSLTTELLTIHEGKYVVRVLAIVGGVTLATSLAAAKSVELAEDRAITRVLNLLEIESGTATHLEVSSQLTSAETSVQVQTKPVEVPLSIQPEVKPIEPEVKPIEQPVSLETVTQPSVPQLSVVESLSSTVSSPGISHTEEPEIYPVEEQPQWEDEPVEDLDIGVDYSSNFDAIEAPSETADELFGNQLQPSMAPAPSYHASENITQPSSAEVKSSKRKNGKTPATPPADMSDVMARTTVEIRRLGWSDVQGKDHLMKTYGKRSRSLLTDQELLEFLQYLESQPSPNL